MTKQIPESYKPGIERIEGMNCPAMLVWLEAELRGQAHILAGKEEDYPVQAIVNHHAYLSIGAQKRMGDVLETLVLDWSRDLVSWPEPAVRALLSLIAELRVEGAKSKLLPLVSNKAVWDGLASLQPAVFRSLATLSKNRDRNFWIRIPTDHPEFAGMAFQVLTRIAPEDALKLLSHLPNNDMAVGSVARKLPDFVSQFQPERKAEILTHIASAIGMLSKKSAETLTLALQNAGFPISPPSSLQDELVDFRIQIARFAKLVHRENRAPQYA
jgi:hypothetical protein